MYEKMKRYYLLFIITLIALFNCKAIATPAYTLDDIYRAATQLMENNDTQAYQELLDIKSYFETKSNFNAEAYCNVTLILYMFHQSHEELFVCKELLLSAIQVYKVKETEFNSDYTRQLNLCLAGVERQLRNFDEALDIYLTTQVMFIEDQDYGISYYVMLFQIGEVYMEKKDYLSAKLYMDEAISVYNRINGDIFLSKNSGDLMLLNQYGRLCMLIDEYSQAEKYFKYVIKSLQEEADNQINLFSDKAYYAAINDLSTLYALEQKWSAAYELLLLLNNGSLHDQYILLQNKLTIGLYLNKDDECLEYLNDMNKVAVDNVLDIFTTFPSSERDNFWSDVSWRQIVTNNLVANHISKRQASGIAYNNTLFCRGLMSGFNKVFDDYFESSNDAQQKAKYYEYKGLRTLLTYKTTDLTERQNIYQKMSFIEHDLIETIPNLRGIIQNMWGNWQNLQKNLGTHEVALEFTYVPDITPHKDIRYYAAFVLRKEYDYPKLIVLCEDKKVDDIVLNDNPDELFIDNIYSSKSRDTLYTLIWSKIEPELNEYDTIYYSPMGSLVYLNFDLLMGTNGETLNDKYNLVRVSSTANIPNYKKNKQTFNSATLFGNIPYDESITDMAAESSRYSTYSGEDIGGSLALRSPDDRGRWGALPYTKLEIDSISLTLTGNEIATTSFEGAKGNEESFKALSGKAPDIIHLATHGFVIDTQKKAEGNKFVEGTFAISPREGYLTWTGLMLAGANNAWTGNFNLDNVEDGVLTADEISRLDLSNTKLVVLSACETARGKIDPVEGALGLQRAFKKAGVQTIVMSLWKVPDESTAILMTEFYRNLMNGVEIHQALKNAENRVKELYPDPYYWAGFIILD